jgi:SPP1 gp7 family putative phage head morphogenesis protein
MIHDRARETGRQKAAFARVRKAERTYTAQLRKIARHVGEIIRAFDDKDLGSLPRLQTALTRYSQAIEPWARATARQMLAEVARRDETAWAEHSRGLARNLRREIAEAPTGNVLRQLLQEQVTLITSLPTEAGERVHRLTTEALTDSSRANEIAKEIMRSGEVTENRAKLIARTETGRTAVSLTRARAEFIGSEGYIWRTAGDRDVRPSHKRMEGKMVKWSEPPTLSDGTVTHAGAIFNCRCYPEPVIPNVFEEGEAA